MMRAPKPKLRPILEPTKIKIGMRLVDLRWTAKTPQRCTGVSGDHIMTWEPAFNLETVLAHMGALDTGKICAIEPWACPDCDDGIKRTKEGSWVKCTACFGIK
jgi:hypothetical protein